MSKSTVDTSDRVKPIIWSDHSLLLLDQRQLPRTETFVECHTTVEVATAIRQMVVRGAPAIGVTAAYGIVLAARAAWAAEPANWRQLIEKDIEILASSRPTAVNLQWAITRMRSSFVTIQNDPESELLAEAIRIHEEDILANQVMGKLGAGLIDQHSQVLTHCNTGALATGGFGTALGVIKTAWRSGLLDKVYADETRPWLQGSRLTAWELMQENIPVTLIADSAANYLLSQGKLDWIIVGADRIAANGDVANKIGTYNLAVIARHHGVKFMVVAPSSTFDPATKEGAHIPIEDRGSSELVNYNGHQIAPDGVSVWNPVFDITPANLVDFIVTEKGSIEHPDAEKIRQLIG